MIAAVLGIATEALIGVASFAIITHYSLSAEGSVPLAITQFPAVLVMLFLMRFETTRNAHWIEPIEVCIVAVLQAALFAYFWFRFLSSSKRSSC